MPGSLRPDVDRAGAPPLGKGAAPGWGTLLDTAPHSAWSGRIVIAKPVGSYAPGVNEMSAAMTSFLSRVRRRRAARLWVGDGCSRSPPRGAKSPGPLWRSQALEPRSAFHVSRSGVAERRCTVPLLGGLLD